MSELYNVYHSVRHINRSPEQESQHKQLVTDAAASIYQKEWHCLTKCEALRMSSSDFMPRFVSSFSFADIYEDIYESIQQCALNNSPFAHRVI
jgi:hypothetical protein